MHERYNYPSVKTTVLFQLYSKFKIPRNDDAITTKKNELEAISISVFVLKSFLGVDISMPMNPQKIVHPLVPDVKHETSKINCHSSTDAKTAQKREQSQQLNKSWRKKMMTWVRR